MNKIMNKNSRLHPLAFFVFLYNNLKRYLLFIIFLFFEIIGDRHSGLLLYGSLILLLIFSFIDALFRYIFFAYRFDENSLTIDSGVFVRHHEHIPFNKIQTIQHKQWFFLQPFGLESLSIETAGHNDGKAEAILPVIPLKISNFIEKLNQQSRLEDVSSEVVPQQAKNKKIDSNYQINFHDLSKYALTSFGIIPTLLGFVGFFSQVDDYLPQSIKKPVESTINSLVAQEFLIILILILLFSLLASYLTTVQKYYHFTLIKSEHKLTTIRGFFQRYVVSLPLKKIQAVFVKQSILRQWLKLATVETIVASDAGKNEKDAGDLVILPVIEKQQLFQQVQKFISYFPKQMPKLTHLPTFQSWYFIRNAILVCLLPIVALIYFYHFWGCFSLLIVPLVISLGYCKSRHMAFVIIPGGRYLFQSGRFWTNELYLIQQNKIQSVSYRQTIWMARKHLVHLSISIRHANSNHEVQIRYLPEKEARRIYNCYLNKSNT